MNHTIFLSSGVESPGGDDSPRHLETLTSNSGTSFQTMSSFTPTTTYYSTSTTYFSSELSSHHGLRLPSLSGVGDLSTTIIKEHPAAVQADQMNSYMEYFVDQADGGQTVHDNVVEEVVVDDSHHLIGDDDDDQLLEEEPLESQGIERLRYTHIPAEPRTTRRMASIKKKQIEQERLDLDDLLRQTNDIQSPDQDNNKYKSEISRQRRAEAARSRYQRMSEQERKLYNQRRRLKALGIDPNTITDVETASQIKETIRMANAKKAEAARLRYHRMTPEEKREYNARRTESFRKRREEEEILLSTPAGCISAEALQKAQQIMVRNARKAESARLRYQRMTPAQRKSFKEYNIRRAQSKKARNKANDSMREQSVSGSSVNDSFSDTATLGLGTSYSADPPANILEGRPESAQPPTRDPSDEIFQQMEREVMKRTKQAKMILDRQRQNHPEPSPRYQEIPADQVMLSDVADRSYQMMIDEKALHDMLVSGRDANGMAVELRTVDGHKITEESQLRELAQGQTIIIAPCETVQLETKDGIFVQSVDGQIHMSGSSSDGYGMVNPRYRQDYTNQQMEQQDPNMMTLAQRHAVAKAKRAERARIRYRNMQPELRQAQNARRADLLRKARARDEELVQMAENRDISTLAPDLQRQIQEAQARRARRAEQARNKYHRMTSEERRQYNAMRDAQRRQRKRQMEMNKGIGGNPHERPDQLELNHHHMSNEPSASNSISPNNEQMEEPIIYDDYPIYDGPIPWDQ